MKTLLLSKTDVQNAVSMAAHSLIEEGQVSDRVAKNFTNGKNAAPRGVQNYDLALMMHLEGYSTNLWATPRQIAEIGGVVDDLAPRATISIEKKSKAGNVYFTNYKLVNLDEVAFPDPSKLSDEAYKTIMDTAALEEHYEVPSPSSFVPDYDAMRGTPKKAPKKTPKKATEKSPKGLAALSDRKPRATNVADMRHPHDFDPATGRPANVRVDMDELGLHFEARTLDECQLLMERTLKQFIAAKQALAAIG